MELNNIKKVYIVGIGGIGTSALARFFVSRGAEVLGSDVSKTEVTEALEKSKIKINYQQVGKNIDSSINLVVYSAAVPADNQERAKAKELNIEQKSYF